MAEKMLIKQLFKTISYSYYKLNYLNIKLISLFLGFFISTVLSTIPAQTGDWGILAGSIIVTSNEILSKFIYTKNNKEILIISIINSIKIGVIYGLFVDAFKLGS
uniref:Uncharacterized protein ycf20 n=1 Tax=Sebdenia flabellata TaxID=42024 RepID=A0A1C9C9X1_9FLOR|nr:hypothetical protein Sebd_078 [Sebdenia flabellata]AOM65165.1 hypothetical protein Sebd_078 [Sebdenia flabellata]